MQEEAQKTPPEKTVYEAPPHKTPDTKSYQFSGQIIGGVNVLESIGLGGMAIVYNGIDIETEEEVVLKVLRSEHLKDTNIVSRFKQDAEATLLLKHSNIVETIRYGEHEGIPYIISKRIPNSADLSELLERNSPIKLKLEDSVNILFQIADALIFSHSILPSHPKKPSIVHRDVKPANIIVNKETLQAKLIDFGIAKVGTANAGLTLQDAFLGTCIYISPEQAADSTKASPLSDLYSWACTAYEVFSRSRPQETQTNSSQVIASNRINIKMPFESWLNEAIEQKQRELTRELNTELNPAVKEQIKQELDVVVPVSEDLEDLIMMVLNAKDVNDRPSFTVIYAKYEQLILEKRLARRETTTEEEAKRKTLQEIFLSKVQEKRQEYEDDKENVEKKSALTKSLVSLAETTPREDDARAAYLKEAAEYAKEVYNTLRLSNRLGDTTLLGITSKIDDTLSVKDVVSWICGLSNNEQKRKERRDAKNLEQDTKNYISTALIAIKEERYEDAAKIYASIRNSDKLSSALKTGYESLTNLIKETVRTLLATGLPEKDLNAAKRCYEQANALSKLFPEDGDERKITAKYHQRYLEKEADQKSDICKKLLEANDFYTAYETIVYIDKKLLENLTPETKEAVRQQLEAYRKELGLKTIPITSLGNILETHDRLDDRLGKEIQKADQTATEEDGINALPEESIKGYNDEMNGINAEFQKISPDTIGPRYEKFKQSIEFLSKRIQAAKLTLEAEVLKQRWQEIVKDEPKDKDSINKETYLTYGKTLTSLIELSYGKPEQKRFIKNRMRLDAEQLRLMEKAKL